MKHAINIPGTASNGKTVKNTVMDAAETIKSKLSSGPKAPPVDLKPNVARAPEMDEPASDIGEEKISFRQMMADFGIHLPSWKRHLFAAVTSFIAGYVIGATASALFNYLFGAAILASGWTFMLVCVAIIGFIITVILAYKAGKAIGNYIYSGQVDRDASRAWGWAKGLVTPAPKLATV